MDSIPLFPLGNALYPAGVLHLRIFEVRYLDMIKKCIANKTEFGVVALLSGHEVRTPEGTETLAEVGTMARIDEWSAPMPGLLQLRCSGTTRFRLEASRQLKHGLWMGDAVAIADDPVVDIPDNLQPTANALGKLIADLQQHGVPGMQMPIAPPFRLDESAWVANRWCEMLPMPPQQKEHLLALEDPVARLEQIQEVLTGRGLMP
jgi:Lon protease-like protein